MLVNPGADRQNMLQRREFDQSGKLGNWGLGYCNISKLPPSFGALACSGDLHLGGNRLELLPNSFLEITVAGKLFLSYNKLKSLPESFSEISVGRNVYLGGNPQLTGVPEDFPNVKGTVYH